jgi:hypothetical protein
MSPTPQQIVTVQTNLANMQKLNDYVYTNGLAKILNAYFLLNSQNNGPDTGATVLLSIVEGTFGAIGSEGGPIGNFAATFLSGMLSYWATNLPANLNTQFADFTSRFQATSTQVDLQLATYAQDVAGNWNTKFVYNSKTVALSDLAAGDFPKEIDPLFEKMASAALFALDQQMWTQLLRAGFVVTKIDGTSMIPTDDSPMDCNAYMEAVLYPKCPAYYFQPSTYTPFGWATTVSFLGTGVSLFSNNQLNNNACAYLFQNSTIFKTINPNGLFRREQVFWGLGLRQATTPSLVQAESPADNGPAAPRLAGSHLPATKRG